MKRTLRDAAKILGLLAENHVLERSGVAWNERFFQGGDPDDDIAYGPLETAEVFATPGAAQLAASRSAFHLNVVDRSELAEGPIGSKGTDPYELTDDHTSKKPRPANDPNDPQAAAQAMKDFKAELKDLKKELA